MALTPNQSTKLRELQSRIKRAQSQLSGPGALLGGTARGNAVNLLTSVGGQEGLDRIQKAQESLGQANQLRSTPLQRTAQVGSPNNLQTFETGQQTRIDALGEASNILQTIQRNGFGLQRQGPVGPGIFVGGRGNRTVDKTPTFTKLFDPVKNDADRGIREIPVDIEGTKNSLRNARNVAAKLRPDNRLVNVLNESIFNNTRKRRSAGAALPKIAGLLGQKNGSKVV